MVSALDACARHRTVVVSHRELLIHPATALRALAARLRELGVPVAEDFDASRSARKLVARGLDAPPAGEERSWLAAELAVVPRSALDLHEALAGSRAKLPLTSLPMSSWPTLPSESRLTSDEAYATVLTGPDEGYFAGAIALGSSIRALDSHRSMLALVTSRVPTEWHASLAAVGWTVRVVVELPEFWWSKHPRCVGGFTPDQDQRWGRMATKLRVFELEEFSKVLYLDSDTLLLARVDTIFQMRDFAPERGLSSAWFNAGVMLVHPSQAVFEALLERSQRAACAGIERKRSNPRALLTPTGC